MDKTIDLKTCWFFLLKLLSFLTIYYIIYGTLIV